jgi:hypothetical protein
VLRHRWIALRVDQDDLDAHHGGVYVQDAFPYLPAGERELFLTSVCPARTVLRISLASSRAAPVPLRG